MLLPVTSKFWFSPCVVFLPHKPLTCPQFVCDEIGGGYCDEDEDDEESDGGILGFLWGLFTTVFFCFA
jgi:hypothetical protein